ncbi:HTH domain-containing protein [Halorientalis pallida]|uniref:HTH domain-containing protein n=1 Tax=Halorientalis pallida TaxID=2479928 RepID=UPI003C7027E8
MTRVTRAELYLREGVPIAAETEQSRILGRLQALAAAGIIRDLQVRRWPRRVTDGDVCARREFAVCREFEGWAAEHSVRLAPAFNRHDCHNGFTGSDYTTTTLPVICLALYDDDDLVAIYPHTGENGIRTLLDGLSMLEADGLSRADGTGTRPTPDPRRQA